MDKPSVIRILHLEDSKHDAELVNAVLQSAGLDCAMTRVDAAEAFQHALEKGGFDLILSDYSLPGYNGLSALSVAKEKHGDVPFIFLSGTMGEEVAVESLKHGATDYVLKHRLDRLVSAVQRALREVAEHRQRRQAEVELAAQARLAAFRADIHEALNTSDPIAPMLTRCCQLLVQQFDAALGRVWAFDSNSETLELQASAGMYTDSTGKYSRIALGQFKVGQIARDRTPRLTNDVQNDPVIDHDWARREQVVAFAGYPLMIGSKLIGVMAVFSRHPLSRRSLEVMDAVSAIIAQAIMRKQAEEKVQAQAALLDKAQDAICLKDIDQRILYWNKGAERLYGWTVAEAVGKNADDLLFREGNSTSLAAIKKLIVSGEWQGELHQVTKDHQPIVVESRWTLMRDAGGNPKSILVINTDITEKKKLEAQFLRAQRLESIGAMAGGIAHDLNNVLSPILMAADLLRPQLPDEESRGLLDMVKASATRGSDMVRQILSFARGVGGKVAPVQTRALLSDCVHLVRDTFPRSIRIEESLAADLSPVVGDPTQLHQVLMNLLVNARDAMPEGGTLSVAAENLFLEKIFSRSRNEAVSGRYVRISVSDTGTGIPKKLIDRIFEPFFTTKEPGKGTGLGLSTVLSIVKSHGGFLELSSQPGQGSTFELFFPAISGAQEDRAVPEAEKPTGRNETILLVDDEIAVLEITRETLEYFNYKVVTAANGVEALAAYQRHRNDIQLVLTDMMMPVMDGSALIHELRELNAEVPIICVSGLGSRHAPPETVPQIKAFLTKPYATETLLQTLRVALD